MPWIISKEVSFDAAHRIEGHKDPFTGGPGKCSRHHGHTYKIGVAISGTSLESGLDYLLDYYHITKVLKELTDKWDHHHLNGIFAEDGSVVGGEPGFEEFQPPHNSSAERIAQVVFDHVARFLCDHYQDAKKTHDIKVDSAWCSETPSTKAIYTRKTL